MQTELSALPPDLALLLPDRNQCETLSKEELNQTQPLALSHHSNPQGPPGCFGGLCVSLQSPSVPTDCVSIAPHAWLLGGGESRNESVLG